MNEPYSRPLSPEAEAGLTAFAVEYIKSMITMHADAQAERGKLAALALLRDTDIDILVFATFCALLCSNHGAGVVLSVFAGKASPEEVGALLVGILKKSVFIDKQKRMG